MTRPLIVVEDIWFVEQIRGFDISVVRSLDGLRDAIDGVPSRPPPIVLLDISLPGVCMFETARRASLLAPRSRRIAYSAHTDVTFQCYQLVEGCRAAIPKATPAETLDLVLAAVAADSYWLAPDQAVWFSHFLRFVLETRHSDEPFSDTSMGARSEEEVEEWIALLDDLATGIGAPGATFGEILAFVQHNWFNGPRSYVKLVVHSMWPDATGRPERATIAASTINSTRIWARLNPSLRLNGGRYAKSQTSYVVHAGCQLAPEEHDLSDGHFAEIWGQEVS